MHRQSRSAHSHECESNRDQSRDVGRGVKRAILPAAISDSTACRLLAEVGSREPSRRRRRDQPFRVERDDHLEQNSAYSFFFCFAFRGAYSSTAERLSVEQEVAGSKPARHPRKPCTIMKIGQLAWLTVARRLVNGYQMGTSSRARSRHGVH